MFVSLVPPLLRLLQKTIFLPSGLNIGNASNPLSLLIFVRLLPSSLIMYRLKGKPLLYSWLLAKMIRLLSGIYAGAQLAWPNDETCLALLPSALATHTSILVGATRFSSSKSLYSFISASVLGLEALQIILFPSGLNHAPPS